jgi:transcriptional regulator with XRE-family HTH domain
MKKNKARTVWDQEGFGARLRFMLKVRDLSQAEFARALRVAQGTVSRWQRSRSNYPGLDHLQAAAAFLNVSPCWLTFGCAEHAPAEVHDFFKVMKTRWPETYLENE